MNILQAQSRNTQFDNLNDNSGEFDSLREIQAEDKALNNKTPTNNKNQRYRDQINQSNEESKHQNDELFRISGSWVQKPAAFLGDGGSPDISPIKQKKRNENDPQNQIQLHE